MKQSDFDVWAGLVGVLFMLVFLAVMGSYGCRSALLKDECLKLGYTSHQQSWTFSRFCIARQDQTDVVLPIEEARKRPRR